MFRDVSPEKAITFTRLSVALNCYWPLPSTATWFQVLRFKIFRILSMLSTAALVLPLLYSMYVHHDDTVILTKVACFTLALIHILCQSVFSIVHHDRIQVLVEEMTEFCTKAETIERCVLQRYVDKYSKFYGLSASWFYVTSSIFVVGTLFIDQPFPTDAAYPFAVDYEPVRTVIYLHQTYVFMQCSAMVCINMFVALLLLFTAARYEILMEELRVVQNVDMLIECLKKYYHVRSYAQEVVNVLQYSALYTTVMVTLPIVLCGLNIIGRQPIVIKVQFMFLAGTTLLEVFMCAWPADTLLEVSEKAMRSVYESTWYEQAVRMQKIVLLALLPQKPITIHLAFMVPVLSLQFFCSYIANAFSMFTTLRLVLNEEAKS
ncbi:odorant receptor 4-like [Hylaeus volcanicus]|uniref:odorant receptor 4-like n=1 Tax=Hylaeus volcanicus TaxID=313075 RepID=UPI0023B77B7D|nr:odorant receptor 4-like [Hylaeus volcanicus]